MKSIKSFVLERLNFTSESISLNERLKLNSDSKINPKRNRIIEKVINTFSKYDTHLGVRFKGDEEFKKQFCEWLSNAIYKYNWELEDLNDYIDDGPEPLDDFDIDFDYKFINGWYYEFWSGKKILGWRREIDGKEDDWQYFYK
jgi:hypothetical protein